MRCALIVLAGCALTSRSAPLELRYFAPPAGAVAAAPAGEPRTPLRLGRIGISSLMGARIVHRDSAVEIAPYETLRWTDDPDTYVRRALERALFDAQPLVEAVDGNARTLDLDVLAFEELRRGPQRLGRVVLRFELHDEQRVLDHGTIAIERPAGPGIAGVVAAIGAALDAAAAQVAARVAHAVGT